MVHLYQMFDSIRWTNSDAAVRLETKKNNSCTKQMLWQGIKDWSRIGNSVYPSNESTYDRLFCFSGSHWVYASSGLSNCSSHWGNPMKLVTLRNFRISPCSLPLPFLTSYPLAIKHGLMEIPWKITYRWCSHLRWSFHKWRVPQNGWFTMETSYVNGFVEYPYGNPHVFRGFPGLMTTHFRGETFGPPGPLPRDRSATPPRRLLGALPS